MRININTSRRKYFRQALELIKAFPPLNTLRNKELDVLSELLYYNYKYREVEASARGKIIFDYGTKIEMREYLSDMDEQNFNNHLTSLRKKGVLSKREITTDFGLNPDSNEIVFMFMRIVLIIVLYYILPEYHC